MENLFYIKDKLHESYFRGMTWGGNLAFENWKCFLWGYKTREQAQAVIDKIFGAGTLSANSFEIVN